MNPFAASPAPPRTDGICPALRDRCRTDAVRRALGVDAASGSPIGEVYTAADDHTAALAGEGEVWGRVVFLLTDRMWATPALRRKVVRVLARAEVHSPGGGHDPAYELEATHAALHARLCPDSGGWRPELVHASVLLPVWRESDPTPPLADPDRDLIISSAIYCIAIGPAAGA